MEVLTDKLGVSTALAALDGNQIVYIDRVQRGRVASSNLAAGARLPAHATSMGHVLLAFAAPADAEEVLGSSPLPALTEWTLTDPAALRDRLAIVRDRSWVAVDQELEIGRRSAAAPIFDGDGRAIAALALSCDTLHAPWTSSPASSSAPAGHRPRHQRGPRRRPAGRPQCHAAGTATGLPANGTTMPLSSPPGKGKPG
jgi:DNA-binding IclR family transcriptional regulator